MKRKKSVVDPETGLYPCRHPAKDIGHPRVMVLREDACCKASLVAGITIDENRFIYRDLMQVPEQFPHIHVVRIMDIADSAPVPDIPHIKKEWSTAVELCFEILDRTGPDSTNLHGTFEPCRSTPGKHPRNIVITHPEKLGCYLFKVLVEVIDNDDRVFVIEKPAGKGGDPTAPE